MKTTLYLIRHGETDWNRLRRVQGSIDIPLNRLGQLQADRLIHWFRDIHLDAIYSSDLMRAYDTASALAKHYDLPVTTFPELRERSYGLIEGKHIDQFSLTHSDERNDWLELEQYDIEPLQAVKQRAYNKISHIIEQVEGKSVAIVSHGGTIKAFLAMISQGLTGSGKIKIKNTAVTEISYEKGNFQVVTLNDTSHLNDEHQNLVV